jgi:hypothetical protein
MRTPVQKKKRHKPHTLVGTWVNGDEYATEVEYIVSATASGFAVRAVDRYDGEEGEVHGVNFDGDTLSFAVHCNSTGRFVKVRLVAISPNRVSHTYAFAQNEMWFRKRTEPRRSSGRRKEAPMSVPRRLPGNIDQAQG